METRVADGEVVVETVATRVSAPPRPFVRAFMTHAMTDAEIEGLSTGREDEFARILAAIEFSRRASPGALQHLALYGPRGFGKSFLTRRAQIACAAMGGEYGPVRYVLLPEEQHNLQKNPHALLETIAAHLEGRERGDDSAFRETAFRWPKPNEEARRWGEAAARLERAIDAALPEGKGLVVVAIENFDQMLATLFAEHVDEQRLRRWLDRPRNRLMVFATATGTVDTDYERPLFQMFQPVRLRPWSVDDCLDYFARSRAFAGKPPLTEDHKAKARAVAEFIGGTPRLALSLAGVLDDDDALSVAETMDALAEKLAEYYRRRIEDLPPFPRGLLDALIRLGEPASATELARRVEAAGQNVIAQYVKLLVAADVVRGRRALDGRDTLYSVTDRVMAHYYRLRQGSEAARDTPLATILDFLKSFYSREEQTEQSLKYLDAGRPAEAGLFGRLAIEGRRFDDAYFRRFAYRLGIYAEAADSPFDAASIAEAIERDPAFAYESCKPEASASAVDAAVRTVARAQAVARLGHYERAKKELAKARETAGARARIVAICEMVTLVAMQSHHDAAEIGLALQDVDDPTAPPRLQALRDRSLAWSLAQTGEYERAISLALAAEAAAKACGDMLGEMFAARYACWALLRGGRNEEAIEAADRTIQLARALGERGDEAEAWIFKVEALESLRRHAEVAESTASWIARARDIGDTAAEANALFARAYALDNLNRLPEALEAATLAVERASAAGNPSAEASALCLRGSVLGGLSRHVEAVETGARALERARAAKDDFQVAQALRHQAWSLFELGRLDDAWQAATESLQLARDRGDVVNLSRAAAQMLRVAADQTRPEALEAYREWVVAWSRADDKRDLAEPALWVEQLFLAAARSSAFAKLDEILTEFGERLAESVWPAVHARRLGGAIGERAAELGRSTAYAWCAELLPRVARFHAMGANQTPPWPIAFAEAFAAQCRDPGLLRDVATLFTAELAPDAPRAAALLSAIAEVDEAAEPQAKLIRLDPDLALVIRRLRGWPDPQDAPKPRKLRVDKPRSARKPKRKAR